MRNFFLLFIFSLLIVSSCAKDEVIDLTYLCPKGDIWLINKSDSFNVDHSLDSFTNYQGAGYHRFAFTNSPLTKLYIDVKAIPSKDSTIRYKKNYIEKISAKTYFNDFIYLNDKDNMLTITNKGDHFIVHLEPISIYSSKNEKNELRACTLKMTDSNP